MTKSLNSIQEAVDSIDQLCTLLGVKDIIPLGRIVEDYYNDVLYHHGKRLATSQLKALYNEACYYVVGQEIKVSTPIWLKRNKKSNLPVILSRFGPYLLSKEVIRVRLALSYLRVYESNLLEPIPDLTSVISPSTGAEGFRSFSHNFENFLNVSPFGKTLKKLYEEERTRTASRQRHWHYTTKMGVHGSALGTCGIQSLAINEEVIEILDSIDRAFFIREESFGDLIRENQSFYEDVDDVVSGKELCKTSLGRLAFLPDKGGKTRLIAVGNYWIQEVLVALHDTLYRMLGRLRQDGTYAQSSAAEVVCKVTLTKGVWSYDLTSATDRFPIEPQQLLLKFLDVNLGQWGQLLTSMPFDYKGKQYKYSVGQPMGLYSSWATFALCHHTIIQYCAFMEGYKTFYKYRVLGDDVAIWDKRVAIRYRDILGLLDVTISESKSIVPENQIKPGHSAEFAKRIFYKGQEYSAIPSNVCVMARRTFWSIPQLLEHLSQRHIDVGNIPVSRISDTYLLHDKQSKDLCRALHIWSIIRRDLVLPESLIEYIPEFVERVDYKKLVDTRFELLMETAELTSWAIMCAPEEFREELEELLGKEIPDNLCIYRILLERLEDFWKILSRLADIDYTMRADFELDYRTKYGESISISDIEFLPYLSFEEIRNQMTDKTPRKIRYSKYLARLVAKVKLLVEQDAIMRSFL